MTLRALVCAGLAAIGSFLTPTLTAQEPPALLATSQYLFVVRGDWIYQYDVDTLLLKGRAQIPDAGGQGPRGAVGLGMANAPAARILARPVKPTEEVVEVAVAKVDSDTEAGEPPVGAGGRYGGRGGRAGGKLANSPTALATGEAITTGLQWLADHQDESGRWDSDGFMKHDAPGELLCTGPGNATHDVGLTGLAMLAMLGDGNTLRSGPYKENLKRAAKWLQEQQDDNGRFGTNASHDFIYDHAIATYAMCEAYGLAQYKLLKQSAQKGINYLESHRNPYSVWRYQPRDNDNDISVTSWCLMACMSGEFFNLQVNKNAVQLGATYLDQVSTPDGRHGYTKAGEGSSRQPGDHGTRFPIEKCETLTAAGLFVRYFLGQDPKSTPVMNAAADLLLAKPPVWDEKTGSIDHYYWYYGTYAMFQKGGRHWQTWNKHLTAALLPHQQQEGNAKGSWDPVGVWADNGGRIYSTALSVLALEASYRYARLVR
jgi:hypothetical protein